LQSSYKDRQGPWNETCEYNCLGALNLEQETGSRISMANHQIAYTFATRQHGRKTTSKMSKQPSGGRRPTHKIFWE